MTEMLPISSRIWDMKYRLKAADGTPIDGTIEDSWRRVARALASVEAEPAALGGGVLSRAGGLQIPARRSHPRGRRGGTAGHALQLLRDGADRGRHDRDLRAPEGSRAHHAAGRRHRLRLLHAQAQGGAGAGRRRRRLGPAAVHGLLGRDVPHHHERGLPPRRHDGLPALRSPRYRGLHRGQARPRPAAHVQPLGAGDRCVHAGGEGQRAVGSCASRASSTRPSRPVRCGSGSSARPTPMPSPA